MCTFSTAFIIFREALIPIALENSHSGAVINGVVIPDLRFADDIALLSENVSDLQVTVDCIAQTAKNLGMCINVSKTEYQYLGHGSNNFQIYINGQQLQQTDNFVYLGGNVGIHDGVDGYINRRIGSARTVFQMLKKVWSSTDSNTTKLKVHETMVLSVLMYNSET